MKRNQKQIETITDIHIEYNQYPDGRSPYKTTHLSNSYAEKDLHNRKHMQFCISAYRHIIKLV